MGLLTTRKRSNVPSGIGKSNRTSEDRASEAGPTGASCNHDSKRCTSNCQVKWSPISMVGASEREAAGVQNEDCAEAWRVALHIANMAHARRREVVFNIIQQSLDR